MMHLSSWVEEKDKKSYLYLSLAQCVVPMTYLGCIVTSKERRNVLYSVSVSNAGF